MRTFTHYDAAVDKGLNNLYIISDMGESFRFIHCSDLHLGCRFSGISDADERLGKRLRESVFAALDNIVTFAKKEKIDFIVFSGDIFDSTNETPLTRSRFADAIASVKIPCFIIYGNHDTKRKWETSIPLPKNAYVFPEEVTHIYYEKDGNRIAELIGMSFSSVSPDKDFTSDVKKESNLFSIGVFHCNVDGANDDNYAPCKLSELRKKNIDYWALGHIHKGEMLGRMPYVVYPGNTQGMDPKETGEKGAYAVTVRDGAVADISFFKTSAIDWFDITADITDKIELNEVLDGIHREVKKGNILSVKFTGRGPLDAVLRTGGTESIRKMIESATGCTVSSIDIRTIPEIDLEARSENNDFISAAVNFGKVMSTYDRQRKIDMICSTTVAQSKRELFESFSDEELKQIIDDATYLVIEKILGADR